MDPFMQTENLQSGLMCWTLFLATDQLVLDLKKINANINSSTENHCLSCN